MKTKKVIEESYLLSALNSAITGENISSVYVDLIRGTFPLDERIKEAIESLDLHNKRSQFYSDDDEIEAEDCLEAACYFLEEVYGDEVEIYYDISEHNESD